MEYHVIDLCCVVFSVCRLRRLESLAGVRRGVACLSRVRGHACVCSACWLRVDWDLDRRRNWSLRRRGMFEDVFWRIAQTVLQFVLILCNIY